jgi:hypothetical protein
VGLIAREIEARGIPTLSMSSALSITQAVKPPRTAFVDYPLGHTTGKPHQPELQRSLLLAALRAFETLAVPGERVILPHAWEQDDAWKERLPRPGSDSGAESPADDRTLRHDGPQYQSEQDRLRAEAALAEGGCPTCIFLE